MNELSGRLSTEDLSSKLTLSSKKNSSVWVTIEYYYLLYEHLKTAWWDR